jgi:predicted amidohydrolase YtcJ
MRRFLRTAQRAGITTVADAGVGVGGDALGQLEGYNRLANETDRSVDLAESLDISTLYAKKLPLPIPGLRAPHNPSEAGRFEKLPIPNLKVWADGSTQGYTAYLSQPYLPPVDPTKPCGSPDWEQAELNSLLQKAHDHKWSVLIHANGDAALDMALEALEVVYGQNKAFRNRIEHCTVTRPEQYDKMLRLGVTPSYLNTPLQLGRHLRRAHPGRRPRRPARRRWRCAQPRNDLFIPLRLCDDIA